VVDVEIVAPLTLSKMIQQKSSFFGDDSMGISFCDDPTGGDVLEWWRGDVCYRLIRSQLHSFAVPIRRQARSKPTVVSNDQGGRCHYGLVSTQSASLGESDSGCVGCRTCYSMPDSSPNQPSFGFHRYFCRFFIVFCCPPSTSRIHSVGIFRVVGPWPWS
jgi:hypothetical protein